MMKEPTFVFIEGAKVYYLVIELNDMKEGSAFCPTSYILIVIA